MAPIRYRAFATDGVASAARWSEGAWTDHSLPSADLRDVGGFGTGAGRTVFVVGDEEGIRLP